MLLKRVNNHHRLPKKVVEDQKDQLKKQPKKSLNQNQKLHHVKLRKNQAPKKMKMMKVMNLHLKLISKTMLNFV